MEKRKTNRCYNYSIVTENKTNNISCVACVKCFVKPDADISINKDVINETERKIREVIKRTIENSKVISLNYIVDFDCTKNNLNSNKWSRMKIDLYLMSYLTSTEENIANEAASLCEEIGEKMYNSLSNNGFSIR